MTNSSPYETTAAPAGDITPELLTTAEAAKLAGFGERTWWEKTRDGTAPAPLKIGNGSRPAVRYSRTAILQWIQTGCPRCDENGKGGAQR